MLINVCPCKKYITFGDNDKLLCNWIGDWPTKTADKDGQWHSLLWKNVLVCEVINQPILSTKRIRIWGHDFMQSKRSYIVLNARNEGHDKIKLPTRELGNGLTYLSCLPDLVTNNQHLLLATNAEQRDKTDDRAPIEEENGNTQKQTDSSDDDLPELDESPETGEVKGAAIDGRADNEVESSAGKDKSEAEEAPQNLYRNVKLSAQENARLQKIALRAPLDTNHTSWLQLVKVAPHTEGLEELLDFPNNFVMDPCHTCMMSKSKMHPLPRKTPNRAPYQNYR